VELDGHLVPIALGVAVILLQEEVKNIQKSSKEGTIQVSHSFEYRPYKISGANYLIRAISHLYVISVLSI